MALPPLPCLYCPPDGPCDRCDDDAREHEQRGDVWTKWLVFRLVRGVEEDRVSRLLGTDNEDVVLEGSDHELVDPDVAVLIVSGASHGLQGTSGGMARCAAEE